MADREMMRLVRTLQSEISDLRKQVKTLQTTPMLRNAAIDDTSLKVRDRDGRLVEVIGRQSDGTYGDVVHQSLIPPVPTAAVCEAGNGGFLAGWDGAVVEAEVPRAFGRVEVWTAPASGGDEDDEASADLADARRVSAIYSRDGGSTTVTTTGGTWTVWLRMVGADGVTAGEFSQPVTVSVVSAATDQSIRERLEEFASGEMDDESYAALMERLNQYVLVGDDNLEAGSVSAIHFSAGAFDGQVVTGALVQTQAEDDRGIKFDSEGLYGYDDEGRVNFWIDGQDNRFSGTFELTLPDAGNLAIRSFSVDELTGEGDADSDESEELIGLGFTDTTGNCGTTGIFSAGDHGALTLVQGRNRPPALMSGQWAVQRLEVIERLGAEPVAIGFNNGWRTPTDGQQAPHFVQVGDMVFLKGAMRRPASPAHMGPVIGYVPAPAYKRQVRCSRTNPSGVIREPMVLAIDTSGAVSVLGGADVTNDNNLVIDGAVYFL